MEAAREARATGGAVALVDAPGASLAANASIEVTPRSADAKTAALLARLMGRGASVYVPLLPDARFEDTVAACRGLVAAGLRPVPHLAARATPSRRALEDWLSRLSATGVDALFLIAGDAPRPRGPFRDSLQILETGLLERHGCKSVGFAGHPEGHPHVERSALWRALALKAAYAREAGLSAWAVTQFAFDGGVVAAWLRDLQDAGSGLPVWVSLAGPTKLRTLLAFTLRCGVGASARALMERPDAALRLAGQWTPDALLADLARRRAANPTGPMAGVHVFPFGGVRRCAEWLAEPRAVWAGRMTAEVESDIGVATGGLAGRRRGP